MRHLAAVLILVLWACAPAPTVAATVDEVAVTLHPSGNAVVGRAEASVGAGAGRLALALDDAFTMTAVQVNGTALPVTGQPGSQDFRLSGEGPWVVTVEWRGVLPPPRPPAVAEDGTILPGGVAWFPRAAGGDAVPGRLIVQTPPGQRAAATGALLSETTDGTGTVAVFEPYADEPPSVFAGPYEVAERMVEGVRLRTYFPAEAAGLADQYLDDTAAHIAHFSELIGPYPYAGFAVVAAPYPVGYGFPGLTYVSERILALPFMRTRSLPHEIVHSWWGNSVTPDYPRGNWAEGLTTFMADYGLASAEEQEGMRLAWLRDLAALPPERDRPLAAFTTKVHGADQVIGYNKAAFVFHMLKRRVGEDVFNGALRAFYAEHRGAVASWLDLRAAFEAASGTDLERFFAQWLTRTGAPRLNLAEARIEGDAVVATVAQDATPPYSLRVPVEVSGADGETAKVLALEGASATTTLLAPGPRRVVAVDPDHHVLRALSPQETPPVLRDVVLAGTVAVVWPDAAPAREAAEALLDRILEGTIHGAADTGPLVVVLMGDDATPPPGLGLPEAPPPAVQDDAGTARAWAWRRDDGATALIIHADNADALAALTRPLPHYGRESWLVFDGSRLIDRGTWQPAARPLERVLEAE